MSTMIDDAGYHRLAYAIVRRAYEDYYLSIMPRKLPRRPKITRVVKGKTVKEIMNDHEYHEWLVDRLRKMQARRDAVEYFLWSPWYDELVGMEPDGKTERVNKILSELEYRRKNGLGMFGDEETEEFENGDSGADTW